VVGTISKNRFYVVLLFLCTCHSYLRTANWKQFEGDMCNNNNSNGATENASTENESRPTGGWNMQVRNT